MEIDPSGALVGITREALRVDDDGISTTWIEYDGHDFAAACLCLASVRVARKSHGVAVVNVGEAIDLGRIEKKAINAIHDPIEPPELPNPAHALLIGIEASDTKVLDQLAVLFDLKPFTPEAIEESKQIFGR
jgi:hypothetical protein